MTFTPFPCNVSTWDTGLGTRLIQCIILRQTINFDGDCQTFQMGLKQLPTTPHKTKSKSH